MKQYPRPVQAGWRRGEPLPALLEREWLVTNALGGYSCGTIGGAATRRFHGNLVAAMPAPLSRVMMLNHLAEWIEAPGGISWKLSGDEQAGDTEVNYPEADFLEEFVLEDGLPVWRFSKGGIRIEKRVLMPHLQNTTYVSYRLLEGPDGVTLHLRPSLNFRPHEGLLAASPSESWMIDIDERRIEISCGEVYPSLRLLLLGDEAGFYREERTLPHLIYRIEKSRGYEHEGPLWSPGVIHLPMPRGRDCGFVASVEEWNVLRALTLSEAREAEVSRRRRLIALAKPEDDFAAQLVLAADQFLVRPRTRAADNARAMAAGEDPRTVIAGYHWFTDWGRDTMISLEGLTLATGRYREAGSILRMFASHIRDGLIPNMFPEGEHGGLYHTADATMWFFHAVHRYVQHTGDRHTLRELLPKLIDIIERHVGGTNFNIHVDPADGLLSQGAESYQLTWMDAKVDGWVVTPRRGKAVEINALFYNALRILQQFLMDEKDKATAERMGELAKRAQKSFNERFWFAEGGYLYDVVDANDPALRPNQVIAISLDFPVLAKDRWKPVMEVVERELLTPVGLRSLARNHPDYRERYDGDLRARDAAYHQGTVWAWLIGPYIDAWRKLHPKDRDGARRLLAGFVPHLGDACIGTISEVFDAEAPFHPRGCAAQAWSVAEVLRCWR